LWTSDYDPYNGKVEFDKGGDGKI
jgi:hypothetical protein